VAGNDGRRSLREFRSGVGPAKAPSVSAFLVGFFHELGRRMM
jgi:hypothetical protein